MSDPATPPSPSPLPGRRSFFGWLTAGLGGVAAVALAVPLVGYFFGAIRRPNDEWVTLGPVDDFPLNETRLATFDNPLNGTRPRDAAGEKRRPWDGLTAHAGVYVRRVGEGQFLIFAMNCTHLGCPVSWFPQSGLFMCPCHGGVYYENGDRASGPPPRGLYRFPDDGWRVAAGKLEIRAPFLPTLQNTLERPAPV